MNGFGIPGQRAEDSCPELENLFQRKGILIRFQLDCKISGSRVKIPFPIWGNCSSGDEQAVLHSQSFFEFELQPFFSQVKDLFPLDDLQ